ncbi:MAG: phosphatidate cytidylyltransferase [Sneathiella sp.]|nr:phosphatidate cytidylyltransferase [Sneathiella sp.]
MNIVIDVEGTGRLVSNKNLSSLQLRVLSASVLAPVAVAALYLGGPYFTVFLIIAASAMCFEWCKTSFINNIPAFMGLTGFVVFVSIYLAYTGQMSGAFSVLLIGAACVLLLTWFRSGPKEWKGAFLGPLYIGVPVLSLMALRANENDGFALTVSLFFVVWATDTGAYFAGRSIGGPKIAPFISPNKTWAGLIGGMICAALVAVLSTQYLMQTDLSVIVACVAGALLAVLAQIGDFAESGWKRYFKVKDASNIIPGHGGVLDRLDGVLFVAPALYFMNALIGI